MKFIQILIASLLSCVLASESILLTPQAVANQRQEIAVVWIIGAGSPTECYRKLALETQKQAAQNGYKLWIDIPAFIKDYPVPLEIDLVMKNSVKSLHSSGFPQGSKMFIAAHSLGTVVSQLYLAKHKTQFSGWVGMGGGLSRNRYINDDNTGLTNIDFIPTLSIGGSLDGQYRVTRSAEGFYQQVQNISPQYKGKHPVVIVVGGSHASFMDEAILPEFVKNHDLQADLPQTKAHQQIAGHIIDFLSIQCGNGPKDMQKSIDQSAAFVKPLIDGLFEEGSYKIKAPCNGGAQINPDTPKKCMRGSPWVSKAQKQMGGLISGVILNTEDNFHASLALISKYAGINQNKFCSQKPCTLSSWTISHLSYDIETVIDAGNDPQAALQIESKLLSNQDIQVHSGNKNANFQMLDGYNLNKCQEINKSALKWAIGKADPTTLARYNRLGNKLVMGEDTKSTNIASWIMNKTQLKTNSAKSQTVVNSPSLISEKNGTHDCKLFSPYRALEWIYVDSLYAHDSRKPANLIQLIILL